MFDAIKAAQLTNAELIGVAAIIVLALLIPWQVSATAAAGLAGFAGWRIRSTRKTGT